MFLRQQMVLIEGLTRGNLGSKMNNVRLKCTADGHSLLLCCVEVQA